MKVIEIRTDSWHYRLLEKCDFYGRFEHDLCRYVRSVMGALTLVTLLIVVALGVLWSCGDFLAWIAACIVNRELLEPMAGTSIMFGLLANVALFYGVYRWNGMSNERKENVIAVFHAVGGKLCVRIRRVDPVGKEVDGW